MTTTLTEPAVAYRGWPVVMLLVEERRSRRHTTSWWDDAKCGGQPKPDLFAGDREPLRVAARRVQWFAERYCATCPVFDVCRAQGDQYGVWGGELRHREKRLPLIPRAGG